MNLTIPILSHCFSIKKCAIIRLVLFLNEKNYIFHSNTITKNLLHDTNRILFGGREHKNVLEGNIYEGLIGTIVFYSFSLSNNNYKASEICVSLWKHPEILDSIGENEQILSNSIRNNIHYKAIKDSLITIISPKMLNHFSQFLNGSELCSNIYNQFYSHVTSKGSIIIHNNYNTCFAFEIVGGGKFILVFLNKMKNSQNHKDFDRILIYILNLIFHLIVSESKLFSYLLFQKKGFKNLKTTFINLSINLQMNSIYIDWLSKMITFVYSVDSLSCYKFPLFNFILFNFKVYSSSPIEVIVTSIEQAI